MTIAGSGRTWRELAWLTALLAVAVTLRVVALGADPLPELDSGFMSDAGTWWKNARLHAVWGVWMVDDVNFGLLTAPAHTLAMRVAFAVLGVGYAQACAVGVVSGTITIVLVYLMMRREHAAAPALLAAAFVGLNVLTIAYDRSAYPESFQLMLMVAAVAAILGSEGRPWLAGLGGLAVAIVLLSKPPGIVLAPIATATWAALWLMDRLSGPPTRFSWRGVGAYAATATVVLGVVGVLYVVPHAQDIWLHFTTQMADGRVLGARAVDRVLLFGSRVGFRLNLFFRVEWYLVVVAAAFGAARLARVVRRPVTAVELAAWVWLLLGLGIMGLQTYQQDRRFLFLIPPLAILSALALAQAIELGESSWPSPRVRRLGFAGAGFVLAVGVLFYAMPFGAGKMVAIGERLGLSWTYGEATGLLLTALALGAALLAAWRMPQPGWRGHATIQLVVAAVLIVLAVDRAGREVLNRERGLQEVAATLDRISAAWPDSERVAVGWSSGTVTLGSRVLPANRELRGPRAAERFRPQLEIYQVRTGQPVKQTEFWLVPGRPAKVDCTHLPIWGDEDGRPRMSIHIYVDPERLAACQAAARAPGTTP